MALVGCREEQLQGRSRVSVFLRQLQKPLAGLTDILDGKRTPRFLGRDWTQPRHPGHGT